MKAIKLSALIALDWCPESLLACLHAVIVWRDGRYDSGKEDIIMTLNLVSDITILFLLGCLGVAASTENGS
jgi:hypothetical protein